MMSLSNHPYRFFSEAEAFLQVWEDTLQSMSGDQIRCVLGVWDQTEQEWFDDAPMLVEFSRGTLSVNGSCERELAIGWNDILRSEPPVWLDAQQLENECEGLDWEENLCWREYHPVKACFGKKVSWVDLIQNEVGLTGLTFQMEDGGCVQILDVGDVIAGVYQKPEL